MKEQKGITLIALIITIIVMVVLAGVAISAIVSDDGVVKQTETAKFQMEKQEILEKIQTSAEYGDDGKIKLKDTYENIKLNLGDSYVELKEPAKPEDIVDRIKLNVKGKNGEYEYVLTGSVIKENNEEQEDDEDVPPQDEEEKWIDNGDGTYTKGDETVTIGTTQFTTLQILERLGISETEYAGTYGKTSKWTVIGVEDNKLKLVSNAKTNTSSVYIGNEDEEFFTGTNKSEVISGVEDINNDGYLEDEATALSWINAIAKINRIAVAGIGDNVAEKTNARSIKLKDITDIIGDDVLVKSSSNRYKFYLDSTNFVYSELLSDSTKTNTTVQNQMFINEEGEIVPIGPNFEKNTVELTYNKLAFPYSSGLTTDQKSALGILFSSVSGTTSSTGGYYLADTSVMVNQSLVSYGVYYFFNSYNGQCITSDTVFQSNKVKSQNIHVAKNVRTILYLD